MNDIENAQREGALMEGVRHLVKTSDETKVIVQTLAQTLVAHEIRDTERFNDLRWIVTVRRSPSARGTRSVQFLDGGASRPRTEGGGKRWAVTWSESAERWRGAQGEPSGCRRR